MQQRGECYCTAGHCRDGDHARQARRTQRDARLAQAEQQRERHQEVRVPQGILKLTVQQHHADARHQPPAGEVGRSAQHANEPQGERTEHTQHAEHARLGKQVQPDVVRIALHRMQRGGHIRRPVDEAGRESADSRAKPRFVLRDRRGVLPEIRAQAVTRACTFDAHGGQALECGVRRTRRTVEGYRRQQ